MSAVQSLQTIDVADFTAPSRDDSWEAADRVDAALSAIRSMIEQTLPGDDDAPLESLLGYVG